MKFLLFICALASFLLGCSYRVEKETASPMALTANPGFSEVMAILGPRCAACHSGNVVASYESVAARLSEIQRRIHLPAGAAQAMPPGGPLSAAELRVIDAWIGAGAPREGVAAAEPEPEGPVLLSFASVRERVLSPKCLACHSTKLGEYESAFALIAEIEDRVQSPFEFHQMPPPGAPPLSEEESDLLLDWIAAGAPKDQPPQQKE